MPFISFHVPAINVPAINLCAVFPAIKTANPCSAASSFAWFAYFAVKIPLFFAALIRGWGASRAGSIGVHLWLKKHAAAWMLPGVLLLTTLGALAETADDFFHGGAVNYLSNNIPKALEVVTNGRALFPDDIKLKKLEELLKQQNQQQQQQQQEQQQKEEQKKQDEKKEQQSKQDQKDQQKKEEQSKQDQQKQEQQAKSNADDKQPKEEQPTTAHAMTPQEAQRLLDAQKGDEKVLQFVPQGEPKNRERTLKDW